MNKALKIFISAFMTVMMCFSLLSPFAIALSGNVENIDTNVNAPEHDISVMSFNILEYDTSDVGYAPPKTRAPYVVATIKKYMPDIVGIQEAANARALNDNLDWNGYLETELGKLGYKHRQLSQESAKPSSQGGMTIGAGLMIFYKSDRFDLLDHDSAQYGGSAGVTGNYQGFSSNDKSRFYHWVKLWDKEKQTYVFTFNTHLSINPSGISGASSDVHRQIGHHRRTQEIKELIKHMERVSTKYPCFATGDYNTHWNDSVEGSTTQHLMYGMTENGIFGDSGLDAPIQVTHSGRMSNIDHVFYNKTVSTALQVHHVFEDFGSVQPSDHKAVMSYYNYGPTQSYTTGSYDSVKGEFTDTTDSNKYTLPIEELPEYVSYRIFDANDHEVSQPLTLNSDVNRFTVRFYNEATTESDDVVFGTTKAIIRYTGATLPVLSAPAAENVYYANDAYHVLLKEGQTSLSFTVEDGTVHNSNNQPVDGTLQNLSEPVTTCSILSDNNARYPLYVYKQTLTAQGGKHLYLDDDIGSATGTVAFHNEDGVIYLTAGQNGFGTIAATAAKANTADDHIVHVAPGVYREAKVTFNKNVTLLGNNADVSPLTITDDVWGKAERRSESDIQTYMYFSRNANLSTTIKGLKFSGNLTYGPLIWNTNNTEYTVTLNVEKNVFESSTTSMGSHACLYLNTTTQKKGRIFDNYFFSPYESTTSSIRVMQMRNPNGVVFEQNYCIGYTTQTLFAASEIASGNKTPGYNNLTVQYNRFENCTNIANYIRNVSADTSAHIAYLYNDFVRGGYPNTHTLYFNVDETEKNPTYFKNTSITVFGNRFIDCSRAMTITRTANLQGDMRDMKIRIQQNRFMDCNQFRIINSLYMYCYAGNDKTQKLAPDNWDLSHNYFTSDTVSSHDPVHFVNTGLPNNHVSIDVSKLCHPYYTNADMTWLSDSSTAPKQTGITISGNRHSYDGLPHSLDINVPDDAVISYSLDASNDRVYSAIKPTLTEPGTLTVYYQVERPGYQNFTGRALITITTTKRTVTMEDATVSYDGQPHSLTPVYTELAGDQVSYTYDGQTYSEMPTFTTAGNYEVTITVENAYANPAIATATATLTITATKRTLTMADMTIPYDGLTHSLIPEYNALPGDTISYNMNGIQFPTMPAFINTGRYTVTVTVMNEAADPVVASVTATLTITAGEITGVSMDVTDEILVSGTKEGDSVLYSVDGGAATAQKPVLTGNEKTLTVTVSRAGCNDLVLVALLDQDFKPFILTLTKKVEGEAILWEMSLTPDREILYTQNVTLLSYGFVAGDSAEKIAAGEGTFTAVQENETGILTLAEEITFTATADATTAAYATYVCDGELFTIYSTIGL